MSVESATLPDDQTDDLAAVRRVADAVLYEGYLLYPYRATSAKNQVRWQFGVLGPRGAVEAGVGEDAYLHTECLLTDVAPGASVELYLRFLHPQWRAVERVTDDGFEPVDELRVGGAQWIGWHEAVDREVLLGPLALSELPGDPTPVEVPGGEDVELLTDAGGTVVGRLVRTRWPLTAMLELALTSAGEDLSVLRITLTNTATWRPGTSSARSSARDLAARSSLVGTHLLLRSRGASFVSVIDPPPAAAAAAAATTSSRCWPVLAGPGDACDTQTSDIVLAAPIVLPEHPVVADESPGDLYDATEIDEILTLRVMTMTDEEKSAARGTDPRAAAIIDRCDDMPPEIFERLHGALRGYGLDAPTPEVATDWAAGPDPAAPPCPAPGLAPDWAAEMDAAMPTYTTPGALVDTGPASFDTGDQPWWDPAADASVSPDTDAVLVGSVRVARGSRVRLRPGRRADAQDLFLAGMTATVRAVLADVDGGSHVAVLLEDDPASELHDLAGRFYYFAPDELEPLEARA